MFNKTVIVYYINVGNLDPAEVQEFMRHTRENGSIKANANLTEDEVNNLIELFVPVRGQDTRIELLTRPVITTSEQEKYDALLQLSVLDNKLDRVVSHINAINETREVLIEKRPRGGMVYG